MRPRAIFGPGDRALFPRLLKVNNDKGIPLLGKGRSLIDLTYVDNVADAMLSACFASSQALGRAYNISGGEPLPFGELLDRLFGHLDIPLRTRRFLPLPPILPQGCWSLRTVCCLRLGSRH